jgi:spore germination protein YaaH
MKNLIFTFFLIIFTINLFSQSKPEFLFYMIDKPESFNSFKNNLDNISIICPQTFLVSSEGVISGSVNERVLELAKAHGIKVMPLIVNKKFNRQILHNLVSNPIARKRSIKMMLEYAKRYKLDGWQFDLEALHITDRDSFTVYFRETAEAFHKNGLKLSAAVVHSFENLGGPNEYTRFLYEYWRAGYNYKELAKIGDFLSIMTYSQHTRRTTPGPVASKIWMKNVVEYLLNEGISPNKISIGIPSYSTHWFPDYNDEKGGFSNAESIRYDKVEYILDKYNLTPQWDSIAGCHYTIWDNGGVYEYMYIEDGKSLGEKLNFLKNYKLRGISVWVLGSEDPDFWRVLKEK